MSARPSLSEKAWVVDTLDTFPWREWSQDIADYLGLPAAENCALFASDVVRKASFLAPEDIHVTTSFDYPVAMVDMVRASFGMEELHAQYVCEQVYRWMLRGHIGVPLPLPVELDVDVPLLTPEQQQEVIDNVTAGDANRWPSVKALLLRMYQRPWDTHRTLVTIRPLQTPCDIEARVTLQKILKCFPTLHNHKILSVFVSLPCDTHALYSLEIKIQPQGPR